MVPSNAGFQYLSWLLGAALLSGCAAFDIDRRHPPLVASIEPIRVSEVTRIEGRPIARLENGRVFSLLDLGSKFEKLEPLQIRCLGPEAPPHCHFEAVPPTYVPLPSVVDLRPDQTMPFRDQGGRDTCQTFATVAAIEAAYKRRYGLDLDLSEQYLSHVHKMSLLHQMPVPNNENIAGSVGGRNPVEVLVVLLKGYGVPPESALPYVSSRDYQDPNTGDVPNVMDWSATYTQRDVDDFNLSAVATSYLIPTPLIATSLPQPALETARYRPTKVLVAQGSNLQNLLWYKNQLIAKREVIFAYALAPNAAHVMLMVGYDDAQQSFMVKNSWGGISFGSFAYSDLGKIYEAVTIVEVADPYAPFGTMEDTQLVLGRWNFTVDGEQHLLDIYRLPDESNAASPDRRIGTYFPSTGAPRRVNGRVHRNRLEFYIDPNDPNPALSALNGRRFAGYLFSRDKVTLAGTAHEVFSGVTTGFVAAKVPIALGVPHPAPNSPAERYVGAWAMNHDGWKGTLEISAVNALGTASARYTDSAGGSHSVTGAVGPGGDLRFSIDYSGAPQSFQGFLQGNAAGLMSGTTQWSGMTFGFVATRLR